MGKYCCRGSTHGTCTTNASLPIYESMAKLVNLIVKAAPAAIALGVGAKVISELRPSVCGIMYQNMASESVATQIKKKVPTLYTHEGVGVATEQILPEGQVTVLHLLRRFK